jgi:2-succinyl-5-enolpyruvyl-6-hydroxy-3-cyclohexene-1-carboxylate synthase
MNQQVMTDYLLAAIHGFKAAGIKRAVISPGSRSTPLALLLHRDPAIDCWIDVDERSAAFFALGMTKVDLQPTLLLCTSGTAAANYYPAICEAEATNLPLVVLTADRPPELRGVGAPQAMDQQNLYASHVKKMVEMTVPENTPDMLQYSFWQAATTTIEAVTQPRGPVHLNFPLREPLLPDFTRTCSIQQTIAYPRTQQLLPTAVLTELAPLFTKKGLLVVGESLTPSEAEKLHELADHLGWPLVGDPLTNLATCGKASAHFLSQADLIFPQLNVEMIPEVVIRFGRLPVTKNVLLWLSKLPAGIEWLFVDESGQWQDQLHRSAYLLQLATEDFVAQVSQLPSRPQPEWFQPWQNLQVAAEETLAETPSLAEWNEAAAVRILQQTLGDEAQLLLANSNAIRFVDRYGTVTDNTYQVFGNRGVNGIDGLISTVAGIAAASQKPTYLLIGDLAFFHDMNGLQLLKHYQLPVTIILLNNNGGGIFSFLSQNTLSESDFVPLFGTPLDLDFQLAAKLYGAKWHGPATLADFATRIEESLTTPCFQIIEVAGQQKDPVIAWQALQEAFQERISDENKD